MLNKRTLVKTLAVLLLPLALPLGGCKVSGGEINGSESCGPTGCTTTIGGKVNFNSVTGVTPTDLTTALTSGYQIIVTVPSNELKLDPTAIPQATLDATTDTGYSSSILVNLTPVGSAPSTLVSGDTDYTFTVPTTAALTAWVDSVNLNTNETSDIVASTTTVFDNAGVAGTYTAYVQITSLQTGTMPVGNATFTDPGYTVKNPGCKPGQVCSE